VAHASFENWGVNARAAGLGFAFTALPKDAFNPAGLSEVYRVFLSGTSTHLFGLSTLQYKALTFIQPLSNFGTMGFGLEWFWLEKFKQRRYRVGWGRCVSQNLSIGLNLNYLKLSIEEFGSSSSLGFDVGIRGKWGRWRSGIFLENINRVKLGEDLPLRAKVGISISLMEEFVLIFDYCKEYRGKRWENFSIGVEYSVFKSLSFRIGSVSESKIFTSGIGFRFREITLDYAYILHPALPSTHQFTLKLSL
jgi:hypothetical protein